MQQLICDHCLKPVTLGGDRVLMGTVDIQTCPGSYDEDHRVQHVLDVNEGVWCDTECLTAWLHAGLKSTREGNNA